MHGLATHGHSVGYHTSRTYQSWYSMNQRCYYAGNKAYKYYGGRGIRVCQQWRHSFSTFLADMGERPKGMTLDREDKDKDYTPGNCRWATKKEQAREKQRLITHNGETRSVTEWALATGLKRKTLCQRINVYGWTVERALTTPSKEC